MISGLRLKGLNFLSVFPMVDALMILPQNGGNAPEHTNDLERLKLSVGDNTAINFDLKRTNFSESSLYANSEFVL